VKKVHHSLMVVLLAPLVLVLTTQTAMSQDEVDETRAMLAIVTAFNDAREECYSTPECPNIEEYLELFTGEDARRTEIRRDNQVVLLEGLDALRQDALRVAQQFTGRRLESTHIMRHGRNVVVLQRNWDPGAEIPNPFTHVFRIQDGKIAHWVLVAP
jgi:SnoaL-like domain